MIEWMMAHPWMTFFIAMTLADGVSGSARRAAGALVGCRNRPRELAAARVEFDPVGGTGYGDLLPVVVDSPASVGHRRPVAMPVPGDGAPVVGRRERTADGKFRGDD